MDIEHMYVVTGENGIGKTTFLKGMLGLFNEYTGNVYYSDENLGKIDKFYLRKNNISVMLKRYVLVLKIKIQRYIKSLFRA